MFKKIKKNIIIWERYFINKVNNVKTLYIIYGAIGGIIGAILCCLFLINDIYIINFNAGFIDPSSSFAESLIDLYNLIWVYLILILVTVMMLLMRIIYLFNWNLKIQINKYVSKLIIFLINLLLNIHLFFNKKTFIFIYFLKLNDLLNKNKNILNVWYSFDNNKQFLIISDLTEYKKLELIWCILPTIILLCIIGPSFSLIFSLDSSINPELNIKIVGKQWYRNYSFDNIIKINLKKNYNFFLLKIFDFNVVNFFNKELIQEKEIIFNYDSIMIDEENLKKGTHRLLEVNNRLLIPIGIPVRFLITSSDVLHSWAIPSLGLKVDAIPGRLNQFIVEIKKPGVYYGQCSELCGPMHGFMPITLHAVTYEQYKLWLSKLENANI